jgi:quinohemoprotein ethanol dehydrogenase
MRLSTLLVVLFCLSLVAAAPAAATPLGMGVTAHRTAIVPAPAFSAAELRAQPNGDWITNGGNIYNQRYSPLDQINTSNVAGLKAAWHTHLDGSGTAKKYSAEGTPVVYQGTMFIPTGNNDVFALNAATGEHLWTYHSNIDQKNATVCCGWDDRGVAIGDGKVFVAQLDGKLVALDQMTGGIVWSMQSVRWQDGCTMTMAPLYYNGMVFTGVSGAEFGCRGSETAWDARTGKMLWRFWNCPGPGEIGFGSWFGNEWMHCGATVWNTPTVDPDLGLIYYTTANADPWNARGPGDNLFSASFVALDVNTGQYRWHYQTVHHDIWDYDQPSPTVLFDITIGGVLRKAIAEPAKTGWVYILDRTNGEPLLPIVEKKVPQNKWQHTAKTQPIPQGDAFAMQCAKKSVYKGKAPDGKPYKIGCIWDVYDYRQFVAVAPGASGGNNWIPSSYNPNTQDLYVCSLDTDLAYEAIPAAQTKYVGGEVFIGLKFGVGNTDPNDFAGYGGHLTAMNMTTNRIDWNNKLPHGDCYSGTFTTAGGLVFLGLTDKSYVAYDAKSGAELWRFKTNDAGIGAPGMTYTVGGKQYVAVYAGGTSNTPTAGHGDSVYAFSLDGTIASGG